MRRVLATLDLTDWTILLDEYLREDLCTVALVPWAGEVRIHTAWSPELSMAIETFRDHSLEACLDADTATRELTAALEAIGHTDFIVKQMPYVAGPDERWDEIKAHAKAGCVFTRFPARKRTARSSTS